ncbi:uncharacterized protein LOC143190666 [Rhynchophorus ferrugineus]|uniref:uncharacterized protein LOC143190666 n=1 Tax=Rhynchophorus ferrugineus TaxID=354439 RepID=UPI003FCC6E3A
MESYSSEGICKIIILESKQQRLFHPKLHQNFLERIAVHKKASRASSIKRCLFGKANPDDTKRLLQQQYRKDQQRFLDKFGFDIKTIEELENCKDDVRENIENDRNGQNRELRSSDCNFFDGPTKNFGRKVLKARRKVVFNSIQADQSQKFITDFYQSRKSAMVLGNKNQSQETVPAASNPTC